MIDAVTVVVIRTVKPGCAEAYESWLRGVGEVARQFEGHLGTTIIEPRAGSRDYTLVFRFDDVDHLRTWEESEARRVWVARADSLCETTSRQDATGMEAWFASPSENSPRAPPKWKMAVVGFAVAFPTIQTLNATLGRALDPLPALVRGAAVGAAMITFMTWMAMPLATRALARWLYSPRQ